MAVIETNRAVADGVRISGVFTSLIGTIISWNDRRATRKALSALSARELEDIGLTRGDISNI